MAVRSHSVPGVYRQPGVRRQRFRRVRTDVLGIVGVCGERRLGELVFVDDWHSYLAEFLRDEDGEPIEPPAGAKTHEFVHAFFANGGSRVYIKNVAASIDPARANELLNELLGIRLPTEPMERVGLEHLLLADEVAIIALPELDATIVKEVVDPAPLPPSASQAEFFCCSEFDEGVTGATSQVLVTERLYADSEVLFAQRYLLGRLKQQEWRWFALFSPPPNKSHDEAIAWKEALTEHMGSCSHGALYWPWLLVQPTPGEPIVSASPLGYVAGIFARRDLHGGPHMAPANEALLGVVGLEAPLNDESQGRVYDRGVNAIRATGDTSPTLWGARTLRWSSPTKSTNDGLAYVNVRRCLTAVERTVERVGMPAVFEPNLPLLRVQLTQAIVGYLITVFESGALRGADHEQAFRVRCDAMNNPSESTDVGIVLCEVDVAIAAAAEFLHFRVGRNEGIVEIQEGAN